MLLVLVLKPLFSKSNPRVVEVIKCHVDMYPFVSIRK